MRTSILSVETIERPGSLHSRSAEENCPTENASSRPSVKVATAPFLWPLPLPGLFPGYAEHPGEGIAEEGLEGGAVMVLRDSVLPDPVVFAAAAAETAPLAGAAFFRRTGTQVQKPPVICSGAKGLQRTGIQGAQLPLVQHIKVAGVQASVGLGDEVAAAAAAGGAGAGAVPQKHVDIVVKQPDAVVVSCLPVPIPQVEELAKEFSVG